MLKKKSCRKYIQFFETVAVLVAITATARASVTQFNTDPFAGTTVLTAPGRQIVGGELFTTFDIATDVFSFDPSVFGIGDTIHFANGLAGNLPTTGLNVVVLQSFDNDANPGTPFGAGNAANLIADQITSPGPGFFIYFNSGLDLARLVYSTDLSDDTADLKVMARFLNLTGQAGRDAIPTITEANFEVATAPDAGNTLGLLSTACGALMVAGCTFSRRIA